MQTNSDFLVRKFYWLNVTSPTTVTSFPLKIFWLRTSLINFVRVGMLLWNIETDKRCIVVEMYQFLNIYYWPVRIFNSSDDAFLVREKRQKILRKTRISRLDLYLITSDLNDLDYPDVWLTLCNCDIRVQKELKKYMGWNIPWDNCHSESVMFSESECKEIISLLIP